ncbi:sodium/proline symporter [Candidatus Dependentiae bacterium]|nr:sodium/proline symporter [Candidatus Dependentiae bacterium]
MNYSIIAAFCLYAGTLLTIGAYFYRRASHASAFIVGNRSLGYFVTAIAAQSSDMGAWLFLGFPAAVYTKGLTEIWTAVGLVFFMWLTWRFVAPLIRIQTEQYQSLTLWTYLQRRYNDHHEWLRVGSALLATYFFLFYIASGLVALGHIFATSFALSYHTGVMLGIGVTTAYILVGGFLAVAWCNVFQGLFLLAMVILVPLFGWFATDWQSIITNAQLRDVSLTVANSPWSLLSGFALMAGWGLGYFGQPHIIVNFMSIDDPRKTIYAERIGIAWQIIALTAAISIGFVGIGLYSNLPKPELLFNIMSHELLWPFVTGLALCGVLAATLSSVNTQLIVAASAMAEDFYKAVVAPHAGQLQTTLATRVALIVIALFSTIIAWSDSATIYDSVLYAWSGLGCSFGPIFLLSLYSNYINKYGACAAVLVGGVIGACWPFTAIMPTLVAGFPASIIAAYYITWLSNKYSTTLA